MRRARRSKRRTGRAAAAAAMLVLLAGVGPPAAAQDTAGVITGLTLASDEPGTISISWDAASPVPGDYRVIWAKSGESFRSWRDSDGNAYPTTNSHLVTGLDEGVEYKVRVRARYFDADTGSLTSSGPWSSTVTYTAASQATTELLKAPDSPTVKSTPEAPTTTIAPPDPDATHVGAHDLGNITSPRTRSTTGTLDSPTDAVDYFKFEVTRTIKLTVTLQDLDVQANLYLEDPAGTELKIRNSSGTGDKQFIIHLNVGTYYIRVDAVGDGHNSYTLKYRTEQQYDDYEKTSRTTGRIFVNGSSTGNLEFTGDRDWFAVYLRAGRTYLIDHKGKPTGHGTLTNTAITGIFDSRERLIRFTEDNDSGVGLNAKLLFTATTTGRHYIEASAHKRVDWDGLTVGPGAKGTYTLFVSDYTPPNGDDYSSFTDTAGRIFVHSSATGEIDAVSDHDWFAVEMVAGNKYRIEAAGASQTSGALTLGFGEIRGIYRSNGKPVRNAIDRLGDMRVRYTPTDSGTYFVEFKGHDIYIEGSYQDTYDSYHDNLPPERRHQTTIGTYRLTVSSPTIPVPSYPKLESATVDGYTLTLVFDEALDEASVPDTGALVVTAGGRQIGVERVEVEAKELSLSLQRMVMSSSAVTVDYRVPGGSKARLQDVAGDPVASFSDQPVDNDSPAPVWTSTLTVGAQRSASPALLGYSRWGIAGGRFSSRTFTLEGRQIRVLVLFGGEVGLFFGLGSEVGPTSPLWSVMRSSARPTALRGQAGPPRAVTGGPRRN